MSYFQNNYRCKKCNCSKFYIAFLAKELKIKCAECGDTFYEKVAISDKKRKRSDWQNVAVMVSSKIDEIETKQNELIERVNYLESKVDILESQGVNKY